MAIELVAANEATLPEMVAFFGKITWSRCNFVARSIFRVEEVEDITIYV
jgi:hypothetical protein